MSFTWHTRRRFGGLLLAAAVLITSSIALPAGSAAAAVRDTPRIGSSTVDAGGLLAIQPSARTAERLGAPSRFAWAHAALARPRGLPRTWCGTASLTDRPTLPAQRGLPTIHVIYAFTADLVGRAAYFSTLLQADISMIDGVVAERSGYRKTFRFDMGTDCGPQYVDIQLLPLPGTRDDYLAGPTAQYPDDRWPSMTQTRLSDAIEAAIRPQTPLGTHDASVPKRNFLVFIDGLNVDDHRQGDGTWRRTDFDWNWGASSMYADDRADAAVQQNINEHGLIAEIYGASPEAFLTGLPVVDPSAGFAPAMTLHELLHTLGAVQRSAPNATDWLHCSDGADVMCYRDSLDDRSTQRNVCALLPDPQFPRVIDCNQDDYFNTDPAAGSYLDTHWNTFDSPFLASCAELPAACSFQDQSTPADATTPLAGPASVTQARVPPADVASSAATAPDPPATPATPAAIRLSVRCGAAGRAIVTATPAAGAVIRRVTFYSDGRWAATRTVPSYRVLLSTRTRAVQARSTSADGRHYATAKVALARHVHRHLGDGC